MNPQKGLVIFGTLRDPALMALVLGRDLDPYESEWAVLTGHSVRWAKGHDFPLLVTDKGGAAKGLRFTRLTEADYARLDYYEGLFGYRRRDVGVMDASGTWHTAEVYWPIAAQWEPGVLWDYDTWHSEFGAQNLIAAADKMAGFDAAPETVRHIAQRRVYENFFAVDEYDLQFRKFAGGFSPTVERAVFVGGQSAIVLPYDPVRDRVLVVEQFRAGAYGAGDDAPWTIEPIAGRIDRGESPQTAARREAREEAGLTLRDLLPVAASYPSPGTTTEFFHVFVGLCDLPDGIAGLGGAVAEDEDIRSHLLPWAEFDARLMAGGFRLLPLIAAGHWLARNREGVRASA